MPENPFLERYRKASNERLLEIAVRKRFQFEADAVAAAEQVLAERGISVDEGRRIVDEHEAQRRKLTDLAAAERDRLVQRITEAGRASGRCLLTGAPATTEEVVFLQRQIDSKMVGDVYVTTYDTLPVAIPLSDAAAHEHRPILLPEWLPILLLVGSLLWIIIAVTVVSDQLEPRMLRWVLIFGPLALSFLAIKLSELHQQVIANRLFVGHPLHDELRRLGYRPVPQKRTSRPLLDLYSEDLKTRMPALPKNYAENKLVEMGGGKVVARMIELLDHPVAQLPAIRVLGELHAKEAIPKLAELAKHENPVVSETARAVLEGLT